ncbi:MAG: ATP-dependent Clp protease proteolytic subunit [Planctomycetota bacterium]
MPNLNQIHNEIVEASGPHDQVRHKYLSRLHNLTSRNIIVYYSGWLTSSTRAASYSISDYDKIGLMSACNGLDCSKGLDLILHTPGGDLAATESIVDYLKNKFEHIRVVVPQLAMSAGTMIACAADQILMGKQSSLGPIDPQIGGMPAHGVIEEFEKAFNAAKVDPATIPIWQLIIGKYPPAIMGQCQKAIAWSERMAGEWLKDRMFKNDPHQAENVKKVLDELGSHKASLNHARHYSAEQCKKLGLDIYQIEDNQKLQDAILSVHHATMGTITSGVKGDVSKIIENHQGTALISTIASG